MSGWLTLVHSVMLQDPNSIKYNMAPPSADNEINARAPAVVTLTNGDDNAYQNYLTKERGSEYYNEHEYFLKAKSDMQKHHHDRVSSVSTPRQQRKYTA